MITYLINFLIEILKLPFGILNRILKLPGSLMAAFGLLLIGAILIIVNHFQVPGGLKPPHEASRLKDMGLNNVGIAGVIIVVFSGLVLLKVLLELVAYILRTPYRAYKASGGKKRRSKRVKPRSPKRSPRKR